MADSNKNVNKGMISTLRIKLHMLDDTLYDSIIMSEFKYLRRRVRYIVFKQVWQIKRVWPGDKEKFQSEFSEGPRLIDSRAATFLPRLLFFLKISITDSFFDRIYSPVCNQQKWESARNSKMAMSRWAAQTDLTTTTVGAKMCACETPFNVKCASY